MRDFCARDSGTTMRVVHESMQSQGVAYDEDSGHQTRPDSRSSTSCIEETIPADAQGAMVTIINVTQVGSSFQF